MDTRKKKLILSGLAITMVAGATTGAALAYLTDGETAENTFTIGDVSIEGIEPNYPGNDSDDVQDIVPNKEVNKDPQIDNDGVNDAIVFMTVDSPMELVTIVGDNGVVQTAKSVNEIFWFKDREDPQSKHENNFDENWQNLSAKEMYVKISTDGTEMKLADTSQEALRATYDALQPGEKLVKRYVFGYKTAVQGSSTHDGTPQTPENKVTSALFDKVQLKNVVENEIDEAVEKIVVKSYAIQATNILENSVDLGTNLNEVNLGKIYDIFVRQNSEGNDVSGTKLNEARDVDLLTPTENGASGTTDPHKNRFGTDSNVASPNNVNPNMPITYNGIYGDWYFEDIHYVFNENGTYEMYYNGELERTGPFTFDANTISMSAGKQAISIPYRINSDSTELVLDQFQEQMTFTRIAPAPNVPATMENILGDWYYDSLPYYASKITFKSDGTYQSGDTDGNTDVGTFSIEDGRITLVNGNGEETTSPCSLKPDLQTLYMEGSLYTRTPLDADFAEPFNLAEYSGEYINRESYNESRIIVAANGTATISYANDGYFIDEIRPASYKLFSAENGDLYFDGMKLEKVADGTLKTVTLHDFFKDKQFYFLNGETVEYLHNYAYENIYSDESCTSVAPDSQALINGDEFYLGAFETGDYISSDGKFRLRITDDKELIVTKVLSSSVSYVSAHPENLQKNNDGLYYDAKTYTKVVDNNYKLITVINKAGFGSSTAKYLLENGETIDVISRIGKFYYDSECQNVIPSGTNLPDGSVIYTNFTSSE